MDLTYRLLASIVWTPQSLPTYSCRDGRLRTTESPMRKYVHFIYFIHQVPFRAEAKTRWGGHVEFVTSVNGISEPVVHNLGLVPSGSAGRAKAKTKCHPQR